jgi:D-alanine-D-alanine ligase
LSRRERIRVGVLFGGRSAEHEVSLQSAKNIIESLDRDKYEVVLIGIDKSGCWHLSDRAGFLLNADNPSLISLSDGQERVTLLPFQSDSQLLRLSTGDDLGKLDVVFPALHGPYGEDGTVQGLLKLADIPFVGAGVTGSVIGMDKDVMKRLLREAGIPTPEFLVMRRGDPRRFDDVTTELGLPLFVKPANLGSSVGITKVREEKRFYEALDLAFSYDTKVLVEQSIEGREIECSVLGNDEPIASLPGQVIPRHEFYSYEAKYIDENGAVLKIPADLDEPTVELIQRRAIETFQILCCEGMARVDFFLTEDGEALVNEINTIPGFTQISMYPKLWEVSGLPHGELLDRLIELALERHARDRSLKTNRDSEGEQTV